MTPISSHNNISENVARLSSSFQAHSGASAKSAEAAREKAQTDTSQLSNLSSLLNSLESAATIGRQRLHDFSALVRSGAYLVDSNEIGRRVIAEASHE